MTKQPVSLHKFDCVTYISGSGIYRQFNTSIDAHVWCRANGYVITNA